MISHLTQRITGWKLMLLALIVTIAVYSPGLSGGWLFDDYPNIVDNKGVQPADASISSLIGAALSSPASDFKRPMASLSFAANYLAGGLNPYGMKLTNLLIHLLNGLLVFLLARTLLQAANERANSRRSLSTTGFHQIQRMPETVHTSIAAALIAMGWLLLPINLTSVLYVVQRMESMANVFVLLGLLGYTEGRRRMLNAQRPLVAFALCVASITLLTAIGLTAKETAVILPLYALLIEWAIFTFRKAPEGPRDYLVIGLFLLVLALPIVVGTTWLLPDLLQPSAWATRDFTLGTRLLSEARVVTDYIGWTLLPAPQALSFYHDDFQISTGLLTPWTTLVSVVLLAALVAMMFWLRPRKPLASLGIAFFLGCHLLTGTILPLELIYEHRNYFASFGVLLAIIPLCLPIQMPASQAAKHVEQRIELIRIMLLIGLMLWWTTLTATTAYAWGDPLRLARELAARAPQSPRAQYELGRTYIIYSHYDPTSSFTRLAYPPLELASTLPGSSILPQQALIFMNSRMNLPLKASWWDSMIVKLKVRKPGIQDESSLSALTQCARAGNCELPKARMSEAFEAALTHTPPSARLLATYADYAWNVLGDRKLGEQLAIEAVAAKPNEPAYLITLIRMFAAQGQTTQAKQALKQLQSLNIGGQLDDTLVELHAMPALQ